MGCACSPNPSGTAVPHPTILLSTHLASSNNTSFTVVSTHPKKAETHAEVSGSKVKPDAKESTEETKESKTETKQVPAINSKMKAAPTSIQLPPPPPGKLF